MSHISNRKPWAISQTNQVVLHCGVEKKNPQWYSLSLLGNLDFEGRLQQVYVT